MKNNTWLFPKQTLGALLKARYPENLEGHWVVMSTTILDVELKAIVYAWSKNNCSYFISTMGDTDPSADLYESKFEDLWGQGSSKYVLRPKVLAFGY